MITLDYFVDKFRIDLREPSPIQVVGADRVGIANMMAELGFKEGAEVGVAQAAHSKLLFDHIPGLHLYCIDPWEQKDGFDAWTNSRLLSFYEIAKETLSPYNCDLIQSISMEAVVKFKDKSLDFVYIDGAHDFKHIAEDISEWIKKVRPGGILYGHDYVRSPFGRSRCHVFDVVNAYALSHWISPWFVLGQSARRNDGKFKSIAEWMFIVE